MTRGPAALLTTKFRPLAGFPLSPAGGVFINNIFRVPLTFLVKK